MPDVGQALTRQMHAGELAAAPFYNRLYRPPSLRLSPVFVTPKMSTSAPERVTGAGALSRPRWFSSRSPTRFYAPAWSAGALA
jgi:hypothetical protein